jgi:glutamate synthase domain-containing protein 3
VLISGWDGGTGASPETSLKHAGLPWELGLAETHQTLVLNDLRSRIVVECDGQMKTGRDVAIACLLGAEEFGVATAALVVTGCVMMRVCHLDTCPVGIATQNPELRAKYTGKPEHVVNFFRFMCEEIRHIMAELGFRTIDEMVGQSQVLNVRDAVDHWKAKGLDFSRILAKPAPAEGVDIYCTEKQDHGLADALDNSLIEQAKPALERGEKVVIDQKIVNINRTVGTMLSAEVSRAYGAKGLPDDTITINCEGSAGQSFSAFGARGITFRVGGDGNDYFGKGLSGAKLSVRPPENVTFKSEDNVIIGNVALYGATAGEMFARGKAGERFCVRNSGAIACCEGVGDHGCEYMTGGRAVILGPTGRNFGAGMSGGIAYVYDEAGDFGTNRCNHEMVDLEDVSQPDDQAELLDIVTRFHAATGSEVAERILSNWEASLGTFVKVMPRDYKAALERMAREKAGEQAAEVQGV